MRGCSMTANISALAQREKFEAWFKSSFHPDKTGPYIKDQLYFAWEAAGAELVEALESEKRICATWRKTAESTSEKLEKAQTINAAAEKLVRCKGRYHSEQNYRSLAALFGVTTPELPPLEHENVHYADAAEMEIAALRQRIAELESRTVKLPEPYAYLRENDGQIQISIGAERPSDRSGGYATPWFPIYTAAGIKVEAE
ncbi:ead/Ea22-like family protein [Klebsiella pneumoniae]|nr:ead/Ea22-like family protein [Klebsiella pneumoniae]MDK7267351.1 ead/Ea22-like family protein [Klebsiella pneumoniae]